MGKFFQQRIEFQESGTGVSYDHVYSDINCKKLVTNQTAVKEFTFGIISEATANSGQMKMQKGEKYVKEFEVKVEGGQTLLTTGGIILRLTKAQ